MTGLHASTHSRLAVIGGILTIAIADSFSDALSIHVSEESENRHSDAEIWGSTISTFLSKFAFTITFIIPVLLFKFSTAIIVSAAWGLWILGILSYKMAKEQKVSPSGVIAEHLMIAAIVIILTHYTGRWISSLFG